MRLSARNQLKGTVASIERGPIMARVEIDVGGGNMLTAIISAAAAHDLGLDVGHAVTAVIKSSDIMVAAGH
jgi:molybdopterin-binding protein